MGHQVDSLDRFMLFDKVVNKKGGRKTHTFNRESEDRVAGQSRPILGDAQTNPQIHMARTLVMGLATAFNSI
jgi:hypothetical protein